MGSFPLKRVSFADLSALRHETSISNAPSTRTPEFLVIAYHGVYQPGSAGHGDALYIVATASAARKAWYSSATILDFRDLTYTWGDEMQWVTSITWDRIFRRHAPFAIVIGDKCRSALQFLLRDDYNAHCVESLDAAFETCRKQIEEYQAFVTNWNPDSSGGSVEDDD
jgi:hypothetical protein